MNGGGGGERQQEGKGLFNFKRDLRNINTQEQYETLNTEQTNCASICSGLGEERFLGGEVFLIMVQD